MRVLQGFVGNTADIRDLDREHLGGLSTEVLEVAIRHGLDGDALLHQAEEQAALTARERMSADQQRRGAAAVAAMAERFDEPETRFTFIETSGKRGTRVAAVIYGGTIGLAGVTNIDGGLRPFGSRADILHGDPELFVVDADGARLDTRAGATFDVYHALVADAKEHHTPVPDMGNLQAGIAPTRTLLTGVPGQIFYGQHAGVDPRGEINYDWTVENAQRPDLLFRPAVLL